MLDSPSGREKSQSGRRIFDSFNAALDASSDRIDKLTVNDTSAFTFNESALGRMTVIL